MCEIFDDRCVCGPLRFEDSQDEFIHALWHSYDALLSKKDFQCNILQQLISVSEELENLLEATKTVGFGMPICQMQFVQVVIKLNVSVNEILQHLFHQPAGFCGNIDWELLL